MVLAYLHDQKDFVGAKKKKSVGLLKGPKRDNFELAFFYPSGYVTKGLEKIIFFINIPLISMVFLYFETTVYIGVPITSKKDIKRYLRPPRI